MQFRQSVGLELCLLSLVFCAGFALGELAMAERRGSDTKYEGEPRSKKCKDKVKKDASPVAESDVAKRIGSGESIAASSPRHVKLRRSQRTRRKKLTPRDIALDAFAANAQSSISCIGGGDYQSFLLLPRAVFVDAGCFLSYERCYQRLVTLGQARAATADACHLRILYVSCSWSRTCETYPIWATKDFCSVVNFLDYYPDYNYIYVVRSCVASDSIGSLESAQLRHLPLAILRADAILVLPRSATVDEKSLVKQEYSDFRVHMQAPWSRMELAVAAVGQAEIHVVLRTPQGEIMQKLRPGKSDGHEEALCAANALKKSKENRNHVEVKSLVQDLSSTLDEKENTTALARATVEAACNNWCSSASDPLVTLEMARTVVAAADKSGDPSFLDSIRTMRPVSSELTMDLRVSLGEESASGEKSMVLPLLLFTVACSKAKGRASYTDNFLGDAEKLQVLYHPIAVIRSPYKERFGTPRQPQVTGAVLHGDAQDGQIVFLKGHGYGESFRHLNPYFARFRVGVSSLLLRILSAETLASLFYHCIKRQRIP